MMLAARLVNALHSPPHLQLIHGGFGDLGHQRRPCIQSVRNLFKLQLARRSKTQNLGLSLLGDQDRAPVGYGFFGRGTVTRPPLRFHDEIYHFAEKNSECHQGNNGIFLNKGEWAMGVEYQRL
nr:hypothetical protein Iba_chr05eCG9990 [Ipomoea batatas]